MEIIFREQVTTLNKCILFSDADLHRFHADPDPAIPPCADSSLFFASLIRIRIRNVDPDTGGKINADPRGSGSSSGSISMIILNICLIRKKIDLAMDKVYREMVTT